MMHCSFCGEQYEAKPGGLHKCPKLNQSFCTICGEAAETGHAFCARPKRTPTDIQTILRMNEKILAMHMDILEDLLHPRYELTHEQGGKE